jgi:abequosyltransferase
MASEPTISICIPTYNFGRYIGATLQSIVDQCTDEVEIVIVDGASTDDTRSIVEGFLRNHEEIRYVRLEQRGGIDRDMAKSVEMARGRYCWLFSSDDIMRPGAIDTMLRNVTSDHDVYLCKHTNCTLSMDVLCEHPVLERDVDASFELSDRNERLRYFRLAANTEAFFSFMGGLVVRRARWNAIPLDEAFVGSCWAHAARMFELARQRLSVRHLPHCLLDRRGENDSFADRGVVNRLRIAIDGYGRMAAHFYGQDSEEAYHMRRALKNEFGLRQLLHAKVLCRRSPALESRQTLDTLIADLHRGPGIANLLTRVAYRAIPTSTYSLMRSVYRGLRAVPRS